MSRLALALGLVAALVAAPGCAEKKVSVSGKVTRGGKPLPEGRNLLVVFVAEQATTASRPYSAETDSAASTFRVAGMPPGRYRVGVQHFDTQHNDALKGVYDLGASPLVYDVNTEGQVIDIDLPEVLPARKTIEGVIPQSKGPGRKGGGGPKDEEKGKDDKKE
jgi:hypothetical protein